MVGHDGVAFGELRTTRRRVAHEPRQVPVRRVDDGQALRHCERNRLLAGGITPDDRIALVPLAGSLLD
jgi:hypothetical protein